MLAIISLIESNRLKSSVEIRGNSYFFSEQTAKRMGFELQKTGLFEKFNILLNYLDLLWMYSLAKGKLSWPNLIQIKTATTSGEKLIKQKDKLQNILRYLEKSSS